MGRKIGPEARIIALFSALPEESRRIVADIIKAQTAAPRKHVAKKTKKDAPTLTEVGVQQGSNAA